MSELGGTLATCQHVRMMRVQRKQRAAILHDEPHALRRDPGAELVVHALNPARDVAVFIHHGQIGGVAADRVAVRHQVIDNVITDDDRVRAVLLVRRGEASAQHHVQIRDRRHVPGPATNAGIRAGVILINHLAARAQHRADLCTRDGL